MKPCGASTQNLAAEKEKRRLACATQETRAVCSHYDGMTVAPSLRSPGNAVPKVEVATAFKGLPLGLEPRCQIAAELMRGCLVRFEGSIARDDKLCGDAIGGLAATSGVGTGTLPGAENKHAIHGVGA